MIDILIFKKFFLKISWYYVYKVIENKYKEVIKQISNNIRLTIEQEEIMNNFFEYINENKKAIIGIKGLFLKKIF